MNIPNYEKIPNVLYLYWDKSNMSYLQYLTVVSFMFQNPYFKIKILTPTTTCEEITWHTFEQKEKYVGKNYWEEIKKLSYVDIIEIDFKKLFNYKNDLSDVHKSDLIRLYYLYHYGGFWSDFDIIYLNPLTDLNFLKASKNTSKYMIDTILCYSGRIIGINKIGYSIGFMAANKGNLVFKDLLNATSKFFNKNEYQCIGNGMYNRVLGDFETEACKRYGKAQILGTITMDCFYHILYNELDKLYGNDEYYDTLTEKISNKEIIGTHWYNGHTLSKDFCNKGVTKSKNTLMYKILDEYVHNNKYNKHIIEV